MTLTALAKRPPRWRQLTVADNLVPQEHPLGRLDRRDINVVLDALPRLPSWPAGGHERLTWLRGARLILEWLQTFPGDGWQARWLAADVHDRSWREQVAEARDATDAASDEQLQCGMRGLLLLRVLRPSYAFLHRYKAYALFDQLRQTVSPDLFARAAAEATRLGMIGRQENQPLVALTKIVLHTGKDLEQLEPEDFFVARAWSVRAIGRQLPGLHAAWELARGVGIIKEDKTLRAAIRVGQRPTAELVDAFELRCKPVRDLLVRYCEERRPAMDYGSFRGLVGHLVGAFWHDIEQHHPDADSINLPPDIAPAWKERTKFVTDPRYPGRERRDRLGLLVRVRAFYLDIQEWALEDPSWAPFAAPSPVRKADTDGQGKARKKATAAMHQRVRERLPQLPLLIHAAERNRAHHQAILEAAKGTALGETFIHDGVSYQRSAPKTATHRSHRQRGPEHIWAVHLETGDLLNLTIIENSAFWGWSIVETLRHTGVRLEELLEITHLALTSYKLRDTNEIVPLLQIVPSKSNSERLLLVSPELASVLATIIKRIRDPETGQIPLVARYDPHERTTGPMLPHLFQHILGWRREVISQKLVQNHLADILKLAGLTDAAGKPLRYTPHDFRRIFATEAVSGGLPVHIAARLLGHENLNTTQAYLAVFQDDLVQAYRAFLAERRAMRPTTEYREPTDAEWEEFQEHFLLRKLELGTCGRPYGTPCNHEHACIRCPMLRVDPAQRPRLEEIATNLQERLDEAQANGWLGEVQGLQVSLEAARGKLANLDRRATPATTVDLGLPVIRGR
ncbi:tyrosine-type recombinase/integrase [Micromonospora coxensis]|uniref:Phage integrase family protein n=1 Tax=Micromonospora coxensis TaxID=356852 RepID=A0A1C5JHG0_9ACTN|nr:site-specific integrase [Micromonospora coxensis]SCG70007.1 Phage integrase family protein [Micromonospora coxensis]